MVAVIFLDIDGVICCNMAGRLEESKLAILAEVVKKTQAKVVLSTDWRRQANLKRQVVAALNRLDIEVIGATPMKPMFSPIRPTEINEWMRENRDKVGVDQWVAIDDRDLVNEQGGRELVGHFVHTHPASGLTKRLADMAVEILSGGSPMTTPGPGEATGFGKLSAALANTAPAVMGGAMAAAKGTFAGPGSPLRSKLSATPGGAAAAPSTLNAVRAVQAGGQSVPAACWRRRRRRARPRTAQLRRPHPARPARSSLPRFAPRLHLSVGAARRRLRWAQVARIKATRGEVARTDGQASPVGAHRVCALHVASHPFPPPLAKRRSYLPTTPYCATRFVTR
jgi:hypothetical protein